MTMLALTSTNIILKDTKLKLNKNSQLLVSTLE